MYRNDEHAGLKAQGGIQFLSLGADDRVRRTMAALGRPYVVAAQEVVGMGNGVRARALGLRWPSSR